MTAVTAKNPWVELWRDSDASGTAGTAHANIAFHNVGNHSPTGINWGYGGSGPAALAGDLLCAVGIAKNNLERCPAVYQRLKDDLVSRLPQVVPPGRAIMTTFFANSGGGGEWHILESIPGPGTQAGRIYIPREFILEWVVANFNEFLMECDQDEGAI